MKRLFGLVALAALAVSMLGVAPAAAGKSGPVVNGETWTKDDSPVVIEGDVVVQGLTIESGTEVLARQGASMTVTGKLTVSGTEDNKVVFTCAFEDEGCWKGIRFAESQQGSKIHNADIGYAEVGVNTNRQAWEIKESHLHDNKVAADVSGVPTGDNPTGRFRENFVADNNIGVKVSGGLEDFGYNTITDNGTGVSLMTLKGAYSDNNIFENDVNASSCDSVGTEEINATNNWWGTSDDSAIQSSICDGNDVDHATSPKIKFSPFETAAVAGAASVEEPQPEPTTQTQHARSVTLTLKRHLKARGTVSIADGFTACMPATVSIQKMSSGVWKTVKEATVDAATGAYVARLRDRPGKYQAFVVETSTTTDVCLAAISTVARHRH